MRVLGYVRVSGVRKRKGDSFLSPELQKESIVGPLAVQSRFRDPATRRC